MGDVHERWRSVGNWVSIDMGRFVRRSFARARVDIVDIEVIEIILCMSAYHFRDLEWRRERAWKVDLAKLL